MKPLLKSFRFLSQVNNTNLRTSVMRVGSDTFGKPHFSKGLTKLAILPDCECPGLICLALPARRKFGLILVTKFFLVEVMKKSS